MSRTDRTLVGVSIFPAGGQGALKRDHPVGNWIEDRYNRRRRHASIGQISPVDFELQYSRQIADLQRAA